MIPKECKRLAEVDFPIAVVSKHAAREKSIRHGHPSTLHLWWARRPLAACRAMLLALLLPDPCDEHCPEDFKRTCRELLPKVQGQVGSNDENLRKALLKFIGDFANWDLSADRTYLEVSRGLVKSAHPEETPLVVDPFAGGGSIPLEALRLGCETFASDLNPVACLILKVLLEDIPRSGPNLAEELWRVGADIKATAEKQLAEFYPPDPDGSKPIAYLWARTVRCEQPGCGAEIPLARSLWLCKKANRRRALKYKILRPSGKAPEVQFEIFEPKSDRETASGTMSRGKAACACCSMVLPPDRVRSQLAGQHGGADVVFNERGSRTGGARLLAVVTLNPGELGRSYRLPRDWDYEAIWKAMDRLEKIDRELLTNGLSPVPDEPLPPIGTLGFRVQRYGMLKWGDLFTARQKLALVTLAKAIQKASCDAVVKDLLGLVVDRVSSRSSSLCLWRFHADQEKVEHIFGRQALPVIWDFAEAMVMSESTGSFQDGIDVVARCVQSLVAKFDASGQVQLLDACESPLPDDTASIWFTDPPYYDAVPYADLSDFFFVWLKRTLPANPLLRDPFDSNNQLTPKTHEIVQDEIKEVDGRSKDRHFFEWAMGRAFSEGRRLLKDDGVGCVVFAHKTTEGWEALLSGMINSGWVITGSWPITTEMANRLRARESAALSASVHLVCRPRPENAPVGDWGQVLGELPRRVGEWIERLQSEHIRGADLVFACIGPALEIYSKYSKVVDAEDREIPLGGDPEATEPHKRGYLAYVWEAVGRAALEQVLGTAEAAARNGAAGALEEDARLTALFLWTLQSTNGQEAEGASREAREEEPEQDSDEEEEDSPKKKKKGLTLVFDVARRFAQPLGIHLDTWEDRIIETEKGIVRLLPVAERGEQLFGQDGADLVAERLEREPASTFQLTLFPEKIDAAPKVKGKKTKGKKGTDKDLRTNQEATTLDRVHAAMLLQASGRTNALRALLQAEQDRGPDFLRLANALSALYPKQSEEKRLLDAMLLAVPK
jgi:putative DNA methylase